MAIRNVIVQCLDESETRLAEEILSRTGNPVSTSQAGVYVRGFGDDAEIELLQAEGLLVEQLPPEPSLGWLEPTGEEEPARDLLSAAARDSGEPLSPLAQAAAAAPRYYLVQLKGPIRGEWKKQLEEIGADLSQYVPDFAFKTPLTAEQREKVELLPFVSRVVSARRDRPSGPRLLGAEEPSFGLGFGEEPAPQVEWEVWCDDPEALPELAQLMTADERITVLAVGTRKIRFSCAEDSPVVAELDDLPQVDQVDRAPKYELLNEFARAAIGVDQESQPPLSLPWDGTGVLVGVADSGVDKSHPDLTHRVETVIQSMPGEPEDSDGHGTHVCGTIAGDGTASEKKIRGIAPGAKLFVQNLFDAQGNFKVPDELGQEIFQKAYDAGVRIHNNSWGHLTQGRYVLGSYEVDKFVYEHPDFFVLFAAGNDGVQTPSAPPDPLGQISLLSLRSPAAAKNALAVGACCSSRKEGGPYAGKPWSEYKSGKFHTPVVANEPICGDLGCLAAFSSRGPSHDERVKPELVAPGTEILSTRSSMGQRSTPFDPFEGQYTYLSGTSMATPVVTGAAAIVRQYYVAERGHKPSAALMRATLINGTVWIDRDTILLPDVGQPNYHQGYGRLDLRQILPVPGDGSGLRLLFEDVGRKDEGALNKSSNKKGKWVRTVQVDSGLPLRVTLAWTDRPNPGLQQDLDLMILAPGGQRLVGNPTLKRPSFQANDRRNNVEQIVVENPEPGPYRIHVLAYNTPFEDQGFSLVVTGKLTSDLLP